jgi:hypothetical protein
MKILLTKLRSLPRLAGMAILAVILLILFVYYPVGMVWVHRIDDGVFEVEPQHTGEISYAVATASALIDREINKHHWTPSDPFFYPGSMLVRMPAFQRGVMASIARFSIEMADQIGRTRGSSQIDSDLQDARGLLNYAPNVWLFDLATSWLPTASSATQYRSGMESLNNYNKRLNSGQATFERRADNLLDTLERIASDMGSASASIDEYVARRSGLSFASAADLYYYNKGLMYGNYLLLRALAKDFPDIVQEKQLSGAWAQMLESLEAGMRLNNFLIFNAAPDSQFFPNHLTSQGFYLMRARTQIREITNILLK